MVKYTGKLPTLPKRGWLQEGDKGANVALMQSFLIWNDCSCGVFGADGDFGTDTKKAVEKFQKKYKLAVDGGWGERCQAKAQSMCVTIYDKICLWAKSIADSKEYKYKKWNGKDKKTQQCPICNKLTGKYKGWNCIGFAFATWKHGGGIVCRCNCGVISNGEWEKILKAKTTTEANNIARKLIGNNNVSVIRNSKGIAQSSLRKGDIISYFNGSSYFHTALYVGGGKTSDSDSGSTPNIKYGRKYVQNKCKVAIRYGR